MAFFGKNLCKTSMGPGGSSRQPRTQDTHRLSLIRAGSFTYPAETFNRSFSATGTGVAASHETCSSAIDPKKLLASKTPPGVRE
jgi:ABC-type molybdate transport system substrate-binding protein